MCTGQTALFCMTTSISCTPENRHNVITARKRPLTTTTVIRGNHNKLLRWTGSRWPHRCCSLANKVDNVGRRYIWSLRMPMTLSKVPLSMRGSAVLPSDGYFGPKSPRPKQHLDRSIRFGTTHARDQHTDPQTTLIVSILCYAQRCDLIGPVTIASSYSLLHTACLQTCYEKYRNKLLHITNF